MAERSETSESVVTVGNRANLPQVYMQNEVGSDLRFRHRRESYPETLRRTTPAYGVTGLTAFEFGSDSGIHADINYSTPMHSSKMARESIKDDLGESYIDPEDKDLTWQSAISPDITEMTPKRQPVEDLDSSPIDIVKMKLFPRRKRLFSSESPHANMLEKWIWLFVVVIVVSSAIFSVLSVGKFVDVFRNDRFSNLNGKYLSIQFGMQKRMERLKREGKM